MIFPRFVRLSMSFLAILSLAALISGCPDVGQDDPSNVGYETEPIAIVNPDWGVMPLPTNLLNPGQQYDYLSIPGVEKASERPTGMNLPITEGKALAIRKDLGYPAVEDSALTKYLVSGMNLLSGFVPGFIVNIPFSQKIDMESLVQYDDSAANEDKANFFFFDVTDKDNPEVITSSEYVMSFNYAGADAHPYFLTVRKTLGGTIPADFEPGHTYLIVITGLTENGLKDINKKPVQPDNFFLVFAEEDYYEETGSTYIAPDGTVRNNVLKVSLEKANDEYPAYATDVPAVQEAEGARQITNYGLKIWEKIVGDKRQRNEVVTAFHFSITENPMGNFFNSVAAIQDKNPIQPTPADTVAVAGDSKSEWKFNTVKADCKCDVKPSFETLRAVDTATIDGNVKLFRKKGGAFEEVSAKLSFVEADTKTTVTLSPDAALEKDTLYFVIVKNGVLDKATKLKMVDQAYFGLARSDTPLVDDKYMWNSPHLDSRIDTLIFHSGQGLVKDLNAVTSDELASASDALGKVLGQLEAIRKLYQEPIEWSVTTKVVEDRLDIAMLWTFTTGDCQ